MSQPKGAVPCVLGELSPPEAAIADLDVPVHVRAVRALSKTQLACYRKALALLSSGGGALALSHRADVPLAGLGVLEALLARSWVVRFDDPEEMFHLTRVAVEVAGNLDPRAFGSRRVADLRARAWGELGNAYRAADRYRSAGHAFGQAFYHSAKGTGDPYLRARLFDLKASLLGSSREFPLAMRWLDDLAGIYRGMNEPHLAGRALIIRSLYTFYRGYAKEALRINEEGFGLIDAQRDPALVVTYTHNQLLYLVDLGYYALAKRVMFEHRRLLTYKDRVNALRIRGIEGRISYGLGELLSAEIAFREVKEGFDEADLPFASALIRLELAMVLLAQDRFEESQSEALAAQQIFITVEAYREFLASVIFLEDAYRRRTVTPDLIESTVAYLRRKELEIGPRHMR